MSTRSTTALLSLLAILAISGGAAFARSPNLKTAITVFPEATSLTPLPIPGRPHPIQDLYMAANSSGLLGYIVDIRSAAKSGPFTVRLFLTNDLTILDTQITSYRGQHGRDIRRPSFLRRFTGKCARDPLRIGEDIDAVSGATISSGAMADSIRRALDIVPNLLEH